MYFSDTGPTKEALVFFDNLSAITQPREYCENEDKENNAENISTQSASQRQLPYIVPIFSETNSSKNVTKSFVNELTPFGGISVPFCNASASTRSSYQSVFSELQGT